MGENLVDRHVTGSATAGVVGRPIRLFPTTVLVGLVLDRVLPVPASMPQAGMVAWVVGGAMILIGLGLFAAGVGNFSRAETPVPTNQPTRVLVTSGVYRWTRNPIYLGFFLAYAGIAVAARSPWMLIFLVPLIVTIRYGVVAREEAYLERRFGNAYRNYRARVRRWL